MLLTKVTEIAKEVSLNLALYKKNPMGMCAIASTYLFEALASEGFKVAIHRIQASNHWGHCFVVVKIELEWFVVDITYKQFDNKAPGILIERYGKYKERLAQGPAESYTYTERWTECIKHFKRYFIAGWPDFQKPQGIKFAA